MTAGSGKLPSVRLSQKEITPVGTQECETKGVARRTLSWQPASPCSPSKTARSRSVAFVPPDEANDQAEAPERRKSRRSTMQLGPVVVLSSAGNASAQNVAQWSSLLASFKMFKELGEGVEKMLPDIVSCIHCEAGTVLFQQGDPPGNCYAIISGTIGVFTTSEEMAREADTQDPFRQSRLFLAVAGHRSSVLDLPSGKKPSVALILDCLPGAQTVDGFSRYHEESFLGIQVNTLEAGSLLGELALMNDQPRTATVQCLADCKLLVIRRNDFDNVLKEEMIRKGDDKLRFLIDHLPGMRDVAVPKNGKNVHPCYFFRKATFPRGHSFLSEGVATEPAIYVVCRGLVEFRRAAPGSRAGSSRAQCALPTGMRRPKSSTGLLGRIHSSQLPGQNAVEEKPTGITRHGVLVAGGVFGTLPISAKEPFTVVVASTACEVFYLAGADIAKLPRKLLDTIQWYLSSATAWHVGCLQSSLQLRRRFDCKRQMSRRRSDLSMDSCLQDLREHCEEFGRKRPVVTNAWT